MVVKSTRMDEPAWSPGSRPVSISRRSQAAGTPKVLAACRTGNSSSCVDSAFFMSAILPWKLCG